MDTTDQIIDIATPDGPMATPTYRPADGSHRPGVVVIMEAFGVDAHIMDVARRFAAEGYVAAAPDLFHRGGRLASAPYDKLAEYREQLRVGFSDQTVLSDVEATVRRLQADPGVQGPIGIVGFCLGGRASFVCAANVPGLAAAAVYYPGNLVPADDAPAGTIRALEECAKINIPIAGFFGNDDANPTPAIVAQLDAELTRLGNPHDFNAYDGAGHGFFCDARDSYRPDAAADAWAKTLAFFAQHLADEAR
jgi:carboxymethylenebutenolidase